MSVFRKIELETIESEQETTTSYLKLWKVGFFELFAKTTYKQFPLPNFLRYVNADAKYTHDFYVHYNGNRFDDLAFNSTIIDIDDYPSDDLSERYGDSEAKRIYELIVAVETNRNTIIQASVLASTFKLEELSKAREKIRNYVFNLVESYPTLFDKALLNDTKAT